jgi:hypothetical protein
MERVWGAIIISLFLSTVAIAAGPKDYQVTGPVLDLKDDVIVIQKGTEKWEIGRDKDTKVDGDLKKGSRVTIKYKMTASSIEVKDAAKAPAKGKTDAKGKADEKKTDSKTK